MNFKQPQGFSLTELLVAIAIVGIIGAIAIPSYFNYARKSYYTQVVKATSTYKTAIEKCFAKTKRLSTCTPGKNGVPKSIDKPEGAVLKLAVSNKGVITVTPVAKESITAKDTYILTPKIHDQQLTWQVSGDAVKHGLALPG